MNELEKELLNELSKKETKKEYKANFSGVGFIGLLTLIFITLKLCNVIAWSWVWVLSPLWLTLAFGLVVFLIIWIVYMIWYRE